MLVIFLNSTSFKSYENEIYQTSFIPSIKHIVSISNLSIYCLTRFITGTLIVVKIKQGVLMINN